MSKNLKTKLIGKKYRRFLFNDESQLKVLAPIWEKELHPLYHSWKSRELSDSETAAAYLLIGLQQLYMNQWAVGPCRARSEKMPPNSPAFRWIPFQGRITKWASAEDSLFEIVNNYSLGSIRLVARESLCRWFLGEVPIVLIDHLPSPKEMLEFQAEGTRPVTALFQLQELSNIVLDGRDSLSFFLHDLGHVAQFFGKPDWFEGQKKIYQLLKSAYANGLLNDNSIELTEWSSKLEYLISDLNTHPTHFLSVFWAAARECFSQSQNLSAFEAWRDKLFEFWNFDPVLRKAHSELIQSRNPEAERLVFEQLTQC